MTEVAAAALDLAPRAALAPRWNPARVHAERGDVLRLGEEGQPREAERWERTALDEDEGARRGRRGRGLRARPLPDRADAIADGVDADPAEHLPSAGSAIANAKAGARPIQSCASSSV